MASLFGSQRIHEPCHPSLSDLRAPRPLWECVRRPLESREPQVTSFAHACAHAPLVSNSRDVWACPCGRGIRRDGVVHGSERWCGARADDASRKKLKDAFVPRKNKPETIERREKADPACIQAGRAPERPQMGLYTVCLDRASLTRAMRAQASGTREVSPAPRVLRPCVACLALRRLHRATARHNARAHLDSVLRLRTRTSRGSGGRRSRRECW